MIGARLKLARDAAGLSLRALADRVENRVSAQAIGKYENDRMMPGSDVLLVLAKALQVSPEYLLSRRDIALSGVEFRRAPGSGAKEERAVEARVLEQLERHLTVEETLGLDVAPRRRRWRDSIRSKRLNRRRTRQRRCAGGGISARIPSRR